MLDESGNVIVQQVIDIFTSFARNVPLWPSHKLEYDGATRQLHCQQRPVQYRANRAKRPTNVASVQLRRELATGKRAVGRSLQKTFNQFR